MIALVGGVLIACANPSVTDGDSLRCGSERLRLLGIDAPELHGCPRWRRCVAGSGERARQGLVAALGAGRLTYRIVTRDRFGRAVVMAWAGRENLSCWQLRRGNAVYKPAWDTGGLVARDCRAGAGGLE